MNRYAYVLNNPYKYVDPTGKEVDLQWHEVTALGIHTGSYHTSVRITPENQEAYKTDTRFTNVDEKGRHYATLGAGPSLPVGGKLVSDVNRPRDVGPHEMYAVNMPSDVANEDQFIARLFTRDAAYKDDAKYGYFPNANDGTDEYNSNSYAGGLLRAAGVTAMPWPPEKAPGFNKPLPTQDFTLAPGGAQWER